MSYNQSSVEDNIMNFWIDTFCYEGTKEQAEKEVDVEVCNGPLFSEEQVEKTIKWINSQQIDDPLVGEVLGCLSDKFECCRDFFEGDGK